MVNPRDVVAHRYEWILRIGVIPQEYLYILPHLLGRKICPSCTLVGRCCCLVYHAIYKKYNIETTFMAIKQRFG